MPMNDSYDGSTIIDVNKDAISEMQLISGAFNAEYGQAMSGIVNITTSDGKNDFGGSVDTYFGDYISNHSDIFMNLNNIDLLPVSFQKKILNYLENDNYFNNFKINLNVKIIAITPTKWR